MACKVNSEAGREQSIPERRTNYVQKQNVKNKLGDKESNWMRLQNREEERDGEGREACVWCFICGHCQPSEFTACRL